MGGREDTYIADRFSTWSRTIAQVTRTTIFNTDILATHTLGGHHAMALQILQNTCPHHRRGHRFGRWCTLRSLGKMRRHIQTIYPRASIGVCGY